MEIIPDISINILLVTLFLSVVLTGLIRHKEQLVWIYALQSLFVAAILLVMSKGNFSLVLLLIVILTVLVKVLLAPFALIRLIKKHHLEFAAPAYVSTPVMLCVVLA